MGSLGWDGSGRANSHLVWEASGLLMWEELYSDPSLPRILPRSGHQPCGQMLAQAHDCDLQPDRADFAEPLPVPGLQHEMPGEPVFPWWPRWVFQFVLALVLRGGRQGGHFAS